MSDRKKKANKAINRFIPPVARDKVILEYEDAGGSWCIKTDFGQPYLDIEAEYDDGDLIIAYSNGNYSEHWYGSGEASEDEAIEYTLKLIRCIILNGAVQIDKTRNGIVYSSRVVIKGMDSPLQIKKINPFLRKKKHVIIYPPVEWGELRCKH